MAASTGWPVRARCEAAIASRKCAVPSPACNECRRRAISRWPVHHAPGFQIGVADTQQDDVFAALVGRPAFVVNDPGVRAVARDSLDQGEYLHLFSC